MRAMINFRFILLFMYIINSYVVGAQNRICDYVNPFIGTAANGHTFPGACVPFGMVQVSPDTGNNSWKYCAGYHYDDLNVLGFSQTHLNGTGVADLGDILILPLSNVGDSRTRKMKKATEVACPGYYKVVLDNPETIVELTATEHVAMHRYTFSDVEKEHMVLLDMEHMLTSEPKEASHILDFQYSIINDYSIHCYRKTSGWVTRQNYYVITFDQPVLKLQELSSEKTDKGKRIVLCFGKETKLLQAKVGISTVSFTNAIANIKQEVAHWCFDTIKKKALDKWENLLSSIEVDGNKDQKVNFYTSLYRLFIQPNNIADCNGEYRGANGEICKTADAYYSTLSLWDTYRAAHPLYTILTPVCINGFVNTMLDHYDLQGYLPIWTLMGKENHCMIGNHSVPVIVEAYQKGFRGFEPERAFKAIKVSLTQNHEKSDWTVYDQYGYFPFDLIKESASKTLECTYDDYCASIMAQSLKKQTDYLFFNKRSYFYKNLFDPDISLMRPKDSNGNWRTPYSPVKLTDPIIGRDFTEGNGWQYNWHVQHDVDGLIQLMGGKDAFCRKLDTLFNLEATSAEMGNVLDVTGLIGQYAHGNEPSHHVAYLYTIAGQPYKTQSLVRKIIETQYQNEPKGLCGNDDCGQMSAWYIFSSMGFYPVDPVSCKYWLGAPQFPYLKVKVGNNVFEIFAHNLSAENMYVKEVLLNGVKLNRNYITYEEIMSGGKIEYYMDKLK